MVIGLLSGLATLYNTPVDIKQVSAITQGADHDEFLVTLV